MTTTYDFKKPENAHLKEKSLAGSRCIVRGVLVTGCLFVGVVKAKNQNTIED